MGVVYVHCDIPPYSQSLKHQCGPKVGFEKLSFRAVNGDSIQDVLDLHRTPHICNQETKHVASQIENSDATLIVVSGRSRTALVVKEFFTRYKAMGLQGSRL